MTDRPTETLRAQLREFAAHLRTVTWLSPVSASDMNNRDLWLADQLDLLAAHSGEEPQTTHESRSPDGDGQQATGEGRALHGSGGTTKAQDVLPAEPCRVGATEAAVKSADRTRREDGKPVDGRPAGSEPADSQPLTAEIASPAAPVEPLQTLVANWRAMAKAGQRDIVPGDEIGAIARWTMAEILANELEAVLREHPSAVVEPLREALRKLANEAAGFLAMADIRQHGRINEAVLQLRIDEARAALREHPVAVETPGRCSDPNCQRSVDDVFYNGHALECETHDPLCSEGQRAGDQRMTCDCHLSEVSSDPRQIEPSSGDKSQTFACTICGLQVSGGQVSFDQMSKEQKDLA